MENFQLESGKQWEEPTPDQGGWALVSVSHTHVTMTALPPRQERAAENSAGKGSGLTDEYKASDTPGRCPTACWGYQLPASEWGPSSGELRWVLSDELSPCRDKMKPLVPVSVFRSQPERTLLVLKKEV